MRLPFFPLLGRLRLVLLGTLLAVPAAAQSQEIGLSLGYLGGADRSSVQLGGGVAFQANYAKRLTDFGFAALYGEVHFLANPLRDISSPNRSATANVATLFLTPGIRLKFLPHRTVSPYVAVGGGYALFEQSLQQIDGRPNPAPRFTHTGAVDFAGGVDYRLPQHGLLRYASLRAEIRDFYTGSPNYNILASGGQNHLVTSGGIVIRFGE